MATINRRMVLNSLIKDETLTITDIAKEENLGMVLDKAHLNYLILELAESDHIMHSMRFFHYLYYNN